MTIAQRLVVSAFLVASACRVAAQDLVIRSFDRGGTITFDAISNATEYSVGTANGGQWGTLATISDTGTETVTATVSMVEASSVYRVEATLAVAVPEGFSLIPAGSFLMGSPADEPGRDSDETQHQVILTRDFFIHKTEVTSRQMANVMNWAHAQGLVSISSLTIRNQEGNGQLLLRLGSQSHISWDQGLEKLVVDAGKEEYPCLKVTWFGAQAYCNYLSDMEGLSRAVGFSDWSVDIGAAGYRLPTESEWEYACRAGTTTAFYTGGITHTESDPLDPNLDMVGWYFGNSGGGSHPVGLKQPNDWGLFDMHGNAFEWCGDRYASGYPGTVTDPTGPTSGADRVFRGGSYATVARFCRSAGRSHNAPGGSYNGVGFRPARSAVP